MRGVQLASSSIPSEDLHLNHEVGLGLLHLTDQAVDLACGEAGKGGQWGVAAPMLTMPMILPENQDCECQDNVWGDNVWKEDVSSCHS